MRRLVDLADTNRFCTALYPQVLATIRTAVVAEGPPEARTIDWAVNLTAPRVSMGGPDPSKVDAGTDPVLMSRTTCLRLPPPCRAVPRSITQGGRVAWISGKGYLATLDPATTNPAVLADVLDIIEQIEASLAQGDG